MLNCRLTLNPGDAASVAGLCLFLEMLDFYRENQELLEK